jgi:hypothetical protein
MFSISSHVFSAICPLSIEKFLFSSFASLFTGSLILWDFFFFEFLVSSCYQLIDWLKYNIFTCKIPGQNHTMKKHLSNEDRNENRPCQREGSIRRGRINEESDKG